MHKDLGIIYSVGDDRTCIKTTIGKDMDLPDISIQSHLSELTYHKPVIYLNRAVRKEHTLLFSGDLPIFAFGTTKIAPDLNPPIVNFGDIEFFLVCNGKEYNFKDAGKIYVNHFPSGTEWTVHFSEPDKLSFKLRAALMPDNGISALLSVDKDATVKISISRQCCSNQNHNASWRNELSVPIECQIEKLDKIFEIYSDNKDFSERALISFICDNLTEIKMQNGTLTAVVDLSKDRKIALHAIHCSFDKNLNTEDLCSTWEDVVSKQKEEENRFNELIHNSLVRTQSEIFDCGYINSVLSLDYCHVDHAWFEGCHKWNCYWTQNFQISAAISLNQKERARRALLFLGNIETGFVSTSSNGVSMEVRYKEDGSLARGYDGMPYYNHQLWQYTQRYGDLSVFEQVFDNIHKNNLEMIEMCDPDKDGLYCWHRQCNAFMYQADHFAVPGAGCSPSIMIAWGFEKLAILCEMSGKHSEAEFYRDHAKRTWNALSRLWDDSGYFVSMIDMNNDRITAHYYTDFVFPILYSDIPTPKKILSYLNLVDSLVYHNEKTGLPLMRVGKHKPDLFGNNNVMPTQMAETAIALFEQGQSDLAYGLLKSCALAYSIFTEAPGSAPERMNDLGKGEPNYMFGNPAAALPYAVISGLFGVRVKDCGKTLRYSPAYLDEEMNLNLSFASFHARKGYYEVHVKEANIFENLEFCICVPPFSTLTITCNGNNVQYTKDPLLNCVRVTVVVPIEEISIIEVNGEFIDLPVLKPIYVNCGEKFDIANAVEGQPDCFGEGGKHHIITMDNNVYRDQIVMVVPEFTSTKALIKNGNLVLTGSGRPNEDIKVTMNIEGKTITANIPCGSDGRFEKSIEVSDLRPLPAYYVPFEITSDHRQEKGFLNCVNKDDIQYDCVNMDIAHLLNSDLVLSTNYWRHCPMKIFLSEEHADSITVQGCTYNLNTLPEGHVKMGVLEVGRSREEFGYIKPSDYPTEAILGVDKKISAFTLLYCTETDVRLTGQIVGEILISYEDETTKIPLRSGDNFGSIAGNYAENTCHVPVYKNHYSDRGNHYCIACDNTKTVKDIKIKLTKEDCQFGLIAVNIYM